MKKIVGLIVMLLALNFGANAQKMAGTDEVKFKTSAKCGMCKKRIEGDLGKTKGVKSAELNLDDKTVSIVYNPKKTSSEKLKTAISKIGYDADEVVADKNAHDALPGCCQKSASAHVE
jgi:periplasmic mercuric ion binding protein